MDDLIEALTIMRKYGNPRWPTCCTHDELSINSAINPAEVSKEDMDRLKGLGFHVDSEGYFASFKFGSC